MLPSSARELAEIASRPARDLTDFDARRRSRSKRDRRNAMSARAVPQVNRFAPDPNRVGPADRPQCVVGAPPKLVYVLRPFKRLLERGQWAALAGLLLWAALCVYMLHRQAVATQVIGHDTEPSIVAAWAHASLASATADLVILVLAGDSQNGPFATAFRRDINEVETVLRFDASQNITYGNSEKDPITTIAQGLAQYLKGVGKARAPPRFGAATATTFDLDA